MSKGGDGNIKIQKFYYKNGMNNPYVNGPIILKELNTAYGGYDTTPLFDLYKSRKLRIGDRFNINNDKQIDKYIHHIGNHNHNKNSGDNNNKMKSEFQYMKSAKAINVDYIWHFKGGKPLYKFIITPNKCTEMIARIFIWGLTLMPLCVM